MNRYFILSLVLFILVFTSCKKNEPINSEITSQEIYDHIEFLASDSLKGRKPGTPENKIAAEYIKVQFQNYDLDLLGDGGYQYMDIVTDVELGANNFMKIDEMEAKVDSQFLPYSFSANTIETAKIVFAGYGFDITNDSFEWNDYSGLDVKDKWVLLLTASPELESKAENEIFNEFSSVRSKVLTASDLGAAGVLFVDPPEQNPNDELPELRYDQSQGKAGIAVFHISRSLADQILSEVETDVNAVVDKVNKEAKPIGFILDVELEARAEVDFVKITSQNVVAMIEGSDPELKEEYIVVGAHYDHLGMGGPGSNSRSVDTIAPHNGADDNASGVAGIIELAGKLQSMKDSLKRSIVFVAFTGEEMGLLGSKEFVENPLIDLEKIKAMVNFDMIGRLDTMEYSIMMGGIGSGKESKTLVEDLATDHEFKLKVSTEGYGPSDHAAFYAKDIPVFFISTGAHSDYHTINDDIAEINPDGAVKVLNYALGLINELANREDNITFQEAGPKERKKHGYNFKVTFGIMPDFASQSNDGLRVDAVSPDGPALAGGMQKGDVIIAIDGKPVKNIYDYMNRLKKLEPGQTVAVDVNRGGEEIILLLQL